MNKFESELNRGFYVENADKVVPWTATLRDLRTILNEVAISYDSRMHLAVCNVTWFSLSVTLNFRFEYRRWLFGTRQLENVSLDCPAISDLGVKYNLFWNKFNELLGEPTKFGEEEGGFPSPSWNYDGAIVYLGIVDRFCPVFAAGAFPKLRSRNR